MKPSGFYIAIGELIESVERNSRYLPEQFKVDFNKLIDKYVRVEEHKDEIGRYSSIGTDEKKTKVSNKSEQKKPKLQKLPAKLVKMLETTKIDVEKNYTAEAIRKMFKIRNSTIDKMVKYNVLIDSGYGTYRFNKSVVREDE